MTFDEAVLSMWADYKKKHPGKNPHGDYKDLLMEVEINRLNKEEQKMKDKEAQIREIDAKIKSIDDQISEYTALVQKVNKVSSLTADERMSAISCIAFMISELRKESQKWYDKSVEVCNG